MYVDKTLWLAYTSSMPPILSFPLSMACDDSDGHDSQTLIPNGRHIPSFVIMLVGAAVAGQGAVWRHPCLGRAAAELGCGCSHGGCLLLFPHCDEDYIAFVFLEYDSWDIKYEYEVSMNMMFLKQMDTNAQSSVEAKVGHLRFLYLQMVTYFKEDVVKPLLEVTRTALLHDCILLCVWSPTSIELTYLHCKKDEDRRCEEVRPSMVQGIPVTLFDAAGITKSDDIVEKTRYFKENNTSNFKDTLWDSCNVLSSNVIKYSLGTPPTVRSAIKTQGDVAFKILAPRIYMLESMKDIQSLEGSGEFSVSSIRKTIDAAFLPCGNVKTRWVKEVPINFNILAWKVSNDYLPTRFNLSRRDHVQDFEVVEFEISGD
ncbi:RNA-directed DNA polymerase, eukaryota, reverse transcriptase zinc-binding domain protein [Tanacetum coccineum]